MEVTKILLLAGWLSLFLGATLGEATCGRGNWGEQRAVKVAEKLGMKEVSWMTAGNGSKKYDDSCSTDEDCAKSTVTVHYFHKTLKDGAEGSDKTYMVISDLTRALGCNATSKKCACAEEGAQGEQLDGTTLCIKKEAVEKHKECIHHAECKDSDLACIFEAVSETNGDCGEIEDMRRFCSGARKIFPSALTLPFLVFVMMVRIISTLA